jgi:aminopeptidase N
MKFNIFSKLLFSIIFTSLVFSQEPSHYDWGKFTRADTLRGMLTPLRTCYDVTYYHPDIRINPADSTIKGSNTIRFKVVTPFQKMQVDLFPNMHIDRILFEDGKECNYTREYGAVFITLPEKLESGIHQIVFYYSGRPQVAKRPPWDGGFTWTRDKEGNPWVCVTCQETGASLWWPNKDHQSEESDSTLLSITVPPDLEDVSNGRLRSVTTTSDGWKTYNWFVSVPINNYDVTVNIGKFKHFSDLYTSTDGSKLTLDYYVMPENFEKAKVQFKEVKTMLKCYEKYFGKYPFYKDGYKLIDAPHNGMEHQSAVAYGNHYWKGYVGGSSSKVGLKFDFIIIHESAHEWWGNSITAKDVADMWIHESFGAYAEALYVEFNWGRKASLDYINAKKQNVRNQRPIIGPYNVNHSGDGDMYDKGQLALNTLRDVINNDSLWFSILRGIQKKYYHQIVTADDITGYFNNATGTDYNYFFDQYLRYPDIPEFDAFVTQKGPETVIMYRWKADAKDFHMPIKVTTAKDKYEFIYPTEKLQMLKLKNLDPEDFKVAEDLFYCKTKIYRSYVDPNSTIQIDRMFGR